MHGTELRQPDEPGASPLRSPVSVFPGNRIKASWRAATPARPGPETRNGLSLARNGRPFEPPFQGQCSRPAASFPCRPLPPPVRLSAPRPHPVGSGCLRFTASCPLRLLLPAWPAAPRPPLPIRSFTSLRIKAFCRIRCQPARLPIPPDLRSLPAAVFLLLGFSAADPRSRSATFSEACCSSNLLEPHSLCACRPKSSIDFASNRAVFLNIFLPCLQRATVP